jgi:hypothetical protein
VGTGENKLKYGRKVREDRRRTMKDECSLDDDFLGDRPPEVIRVFRVEPGTRSFQGR